MSESYCMKSCTECAREGCPGCRAGAFEGRCEIVKCCRNTMHESCETCTNRSFCGKWRGRDQMPQKALYMKSREEVQAEKSRVAAVALAKWVKVIFWSMIAMQVANLAGLLENWFPAVRWVNLTVTFVLSPVVCWAYYSLREADWGFGSVAGLQLAGLVITLLCGLFPNERPLAFILMIPNFVLGIIMVKRKCETFRDVVGNLNADLYEKWDKQWSLYLISMGLLVAGLVVAFLFPLLGVLVVIGGLVLLMVVFIREYVCLWQTAEVCEEYRYL